VYFVIYTRASYICELKHACMQLNCLFDTPRRTIRSNGTYYGGVLRLFWHDARHEFAERIDLNLSVIDITILDGQVPPPATTLGPCEIAVSIVSIFLFLFLASFRCSKSKRIIRTIIKTCQKKIMNNPHTKYNTIIKYTMKSTIVTNV